MLVRALESEISGWVWAGNVGAGVAQKDGRWKRGFRRHLCILWQEDMLRLLES